MSSPAVDPSFEVQPAALQDAAADLDAIHTALANAVAAFEGSALDMTGAFAGQPGPESTYRQAVSQAASGLAQVCETLATATAGLRSNSGDYTGTDALIASSFSAQEGGR